MLWAIVARSLLSWFPDTRNNQFIKMLHQLTDPILVPLSRIIPRAGLFDFSPMVAILILLGLSEIFK